MNVTNFVIHGIDKKQNANPFVHPAKGCSPIDDKVSRFAETAFALFTRQAKGMLYADFESGGAKELFQNYLSSCYTQKKDGFLQFTLNSVNHLADQMTGVNFATGGYLIFCEIDTNGQQSLYVLFLNQELKFGVDEKTMTLVDVAALNLEEMAVGCVVAIHKWAAQEMEPVSFVRGSRAVSDYFMRFVGAQPKQKPKDSSRALTTYTTNFLDEKQIEGGERVDRLKRMHAYCVKQFRANQPVDLKVIGSIVYQENQDEFFHLANSKGLSSEFHVDERYLKSLLQIEYKAKGVSLRLDRTAIRDNVAVNVEKAELTLKNVDPGTLKEVEQALGNGSA